MLLYTDTLLYYIEKMRACPTKTRKKKNERDRTLTKYYYGKRERYRGVPFLFFYLHSYIS